MMRRRGPGLVGTMAKTAVVAGTATAVSHRVSRRQAGREQANQQQQQAQDAALQSQAEMDQMQAQMDQMQAQQAQQAVQAAAPVASATAAPDLSTQLAKLAELKAQGILSDAEFEAAKAKLLAG